MLRTLSAACLAPLCHTAHAAPERGPPDREEVGGLTARRWQDRAPE